MPSSKFTTIEQKFQRESRKRTYYEVFIDILLDTFKHQYIYCPNMDAWFLWDFDDLRWHNIKRENIYDIIRKIRVHLLEYIDNPEVRQRVQETLTQENLVADTYNDLCERLKHET